MITLHSKCAPIILPKWHLFIYFKNWHFPSPYICSTFQTFVPCKLWPILQKYQFLLITSSGWIIWPRKIFRFVFYIQTARLMNFSSLIALEHRFLKFHHFLELEKIRILVRFQKRVLWSFTCRKFWKTGKNGWCPCILCWKAVGTLGTNCSWRWPHLRMSGIAHNTHAVWYQVRDNRIL